jgi:hypothetical protein
MVQEVTPVVEPCGLSKKEALFPAKTSVAPNAINSSDKIVDQVTFKLLSII